MQGKPSIGGPGGLDLSNEYPGLVGSRAKMVSNDVLARMCNTQCPPTGHEEKKANLNPRCA